ncbi:MAG: hypothetical protein INQ03_15715 [Candidatus Heimdallarchaeota archaeon]|nr:hypothetical protein [Candidatus Heimdallarchaeota archaeon]
MIEPDFDLLESDDILATKQNYQAGYIQIDPKGTVPFIQCADGTQFYDISNEVSHYPSNLTVWFFKLKIDNIEWGFKKNINGKDFAFRGYYNLFLIPGKSYAQFAANLNNIGNEINKNKFHRHFSKEVISAVSSDLNLDLLKICLENQDLVENKYNNQGQLIPSVWFIKRMSCRNLERRYNFKLDIWIEEIIEV